MSKASRLFLLHFGNRGRRYAQHDRPEEQRSASYRIAILRQHHMAVRIGRLRPKLLSEHTVSVSVHQRSNESQPSPLLALSYAALDDMCQRHDVEIARLMQSVQAS